MSLFKDDKARDKSRKFIANLYFPKEDGFSPWAIYTQACHESAFFSRVIGENNYWGIKKPKNWGGPVNNVMTHEFINGEKVAKVEPFIDWDKTDEALAFYTGLIQRLYKKSFESRSCANCFIRNLTSGEFKWATDPIYSEKLLSLYDMLRKEEEVVHDFNALLPIGEKKEIPSL